MTAYCHKYLSLLETLKEKVNDTIKGFLKEPKANVSRVWFVHIESGFTNTKEVGMRRHIILAIEDQKYLCIRYKSAIIP